MKQSELAKAIKLLIKIRNEREQMKEREIREARKLKPPYLEIISVIVGVVAVIIAGILVIIS